jgi:putative serine/threonine protein kinase
MLNTKRLSKGKLECRRGMTVRTLEKLSEEPFASIVCYPEVVKTELKKRLDELRKLKITGIEFSGQKQVLNLQVLGKGCVGIVVLALRGKTRVALKIRRTDADRKNMIREAKLLKKANEVGVAPKLIDVCKNFLVMERISGDLLPEWVEKKVSKEETCRVLKDILEQCWRLDMIGLDHGELSHAPKHIIVNKRQKPIIVDFETASVGRRPSNVTSACQFLFMNKKTSKISMKLGLEDTKSMVEALRRYKRNRSLTNFTDVLESCGLHDT